jgi:hypothetical protein
MENRPFRVRIDLAPQTLLRRDRFFEPHWDIDLHRSRLGSEQRRVESTRIESTHEGDVWADLGLLAQPEAQKRTSG